MRIRLAALWLCAAATTAFGAQQEQTPASAAAFEVVRDHIDIEVSPDGSDILSREEVYKVLNAQGIDSLHERRIGFTQGYENLQIVAAYTLKASGQRIDVPRNGILTGYGQTSQPGFQDSVIVSIFFPNLEIGDSVVLATVHRQLIPWFKGRYDFRNDFSRATPAHDVQIALSAPASLPLVFDQTGLTGGVARTYGDKRRWTWEYRNDKPIVPEDDAVAEADFGPHLVVTSFADYADVARAYGDRTRPVSVVTPEIQALADQLTQGVADRRMQAKILYDWVSSHIAYVQIVLGAGGFTPHNAKDVLVNRYGDCKDHVALLEALLRAKGIESTGALIRIGVASYKLSAAAMPHAFDHVITYIPEFDLYLDSTAQIAPFGVLPYSDSGKPVLLVSTGQVAHTPTAKPSTSVVRSVGEVVLQENGAAQVKMTMTASGAIGVSTRSWMQEIQAGKETQFLRDMLGPGAEGTLDRGDPTKLAEPYVAGARYRLPGAISVPGPGALPSGLVLKPFSFTMLIGGEMPAVRGSDYVCPSLLAEQEITYTFPAGYRMLSIPEPQVLTVEDIRLQIDFERMDARTVREKATLRVEHPQASCTPEYYRRVQGSLERMVNKLREQLIYRGPREGGQ
jgi:transglutaminase-like putative cysteine protease